MKALRISLVCLCVLLVCGCAQFFRNDLSLIDKAKLDAKAMKIWYVGAYASLVQIELDPALPPKTLYTLQKNVNPKMNKLKRILIAYIDSVMLAEQVSTPKVVMDDSKLVSLMTAIVNDLNELGLLDRLQHKEESNQDDSLRAFRGKLASLEDLVEERRVAWQ